MKFLRRLFVLLIVLVLLVGGALLFVTSSWFLTGVVLPLIQSETLLLHADTVSPGLQKAELGGFNLVLRNQDRSTNMQVFVQSLKVRYSLGSLLQKPPRLTEIAIHNPRVTIYQGKEVKEEKEKKETRIEDFDLRESLGKLNFPCVIEKFSLTGASFTFAGADKKLISGFSGELNNFGPKRETALRFGGQARYLMADDVSLEKLPWEIKGNFKFGETLVPNTAAVTLAATNFTGRAGQIDLKAWSLLGDLTIDCKEDGRLINLENLSLELKEKEKDVTSVNAVASLDFSTGDAQGALALSALPAELWQKILGDKIPLALNKLEAIARLGFYWENSARTLSFTENQYFRNLSYTAYPALPLISEESVCTGSFTFTTKTLRLEQADIKARRPDGQLMLSFALQKPLVAKIDELASGKLCPASVVYSIHEADLLWLQPLLKEDKNKIYSGTLSLNGRSSYDPLLDSFEAACECALNKVNFKTGEKHYRQLTAESSFEGALQGGTNLNFRLASLKANLGKEKILELSARAKGVWQNKRLEAAWNAATISSRLWEPEGKAEERWLFSTLGSLNLQNPSVTLGQTSVTAARGNNAAQQIALSGQFFLEPEKGWQKLIVRAGDLDLGALTAPKDPAAKDQNKNSQQTAHEEAKEPLQPLPVEKWLALADIEARSVRYENWLISPCKLTAVLSNGVASVASRDFGLCEGGVKLFSHAVLTKTDYPFGLNLQATNISCSAVCNSLSPGAGKQFSGLAKIDCAAQGLAGTGTKNLTAQIKGDVIEGAFHHVKVLEQIANALHYQKLADFNFNTYELEAAITNEIVYISKSIVKSEAIGLNGKGSVGFDTTLDLALNLSLSAKAVGEILASVAPKSVFSEKLQASYNLPPIVVTGTVSNPVILSADNILRSLLETLGSNLQLFLDVVPTDKIQEHVQKGIEKFTGVIDQGKNSKAAQKADKLIQDGKDTILKIFGK